MSQRSKKSVDTDDRVDQVAKMRTAGYILASEISNKMGITRSAVSRWASDGSVESMLVTNRMYVKLTSLIAYLGEEKATIFGFMEKKKAGGAK